MARNAVELSTVGGLAAIVLWSATFGLARSLSEQVGSLTGGAAAYLIGGSICVFRLALSKSHSAQLLKLPRSYIFGCGSLFIFYTAAVYLAVGLAGDREQLLEIALVNYLWPSLTVLGSVLLLGNTANRWLLPGTGLALVGVFLVMTQGAHVSWVTFANHLRSNPGAYGLALAAAISWALYSILTRRWSGPGAGGAVELFIPATGLVLLALRLLLHQPGKWSFHAFGEASVLAAVTAVAYLLWDVSMRRGNLLLVVACSYFTPLLSTIVSCLYLRVTPAPALWMGCLVLVAGSFLTWYSMAETRGSSSS